jgi:Flp pilus assembly protein TadD
MWEDAIATYHELIRLDPSYAEAYYNLAVALKQKEDFDGATAELQKAIALQPSLPEPYYTLGVILWQQGKLEDAATQFRAAIGARPDYQQAHYILGSVLRQKGELEAALEELQTALHLDPNDAGAHQALGMVLRQKADPNGASAEFQKADALNKAKMDTQAATLATNTGAKQLRQGDVNPAIEQFRNALKLAPDYAPAHYQLALALERKGDLDQARTEFDKAQQLNPHLKRPRK